MSVPAVIGLFLIAKGWFTRRTGNEPFCSRCGYNLTGLCSSICPECGQDTQTTGIVYGVRQRRPRLIFAGASLALLPLLFVITDAYTRLSQINWYLYKPTVLVISDAASSDMKLAKRAYRELNRRLTNHKLSDAQCTAVANTALATLTRTRSLGIYNEPYIDVLDGLRIQNKLSPSQADQFLSELSDITMRVRPQTLVRIGVPIEFKCRLRNGNTQLWSLINVVAVEDGNPIKELAKLDSKSKPVSLNSSFLKKMTVPSPGIYDVSIKIKTRVYERNYSTPLYENEKLLTAQSQVLEDEPPDFIKLIRTPDLIEPMRAAVQIVGIQQQKDINHPRLLFELRPPPVHVAYKIWVFSGKVMLGTGKFELRKGAKGNRQLVFLTGSLTGVSWVDIVLTPDTEFAENTIDLTEIWGRPMTFKKVPIVGQFISRSPMKSEPIASSSQAN